MFGKFWMVVGRGTPTHRHPTLQSAKAEAERLARIDPTQEFVVLESVSACKKNDVTWTDAAEAYHGESPRTNRASDSSVACPRSSIGRALVL